MRFLLVPILVVVGCSFDGSNTSNWGMDASGSNPDASSQPDAERTVDASVPSSRDGFATAAERWMVPDSESLQGFFSIEATSSVAGERWFVSDMNMDGIVDLVQTMNPSTMRVWENNGVPFWAVFLGATSGFSMSAVQWKVPDTGLLDGFLAPSLVVGTMGAPGTESWNVEDLNGDGCIDFIRLLDPMTGSVWSEMNGSLYWEVYLCTFGGFTSSPIVWSVPDPIFSTTESEALLLMSCWRLLDLTGNGRSDLVHTCGNGEVAPWESTTNPHWRVYENLSNGFSDVPVIGQVPRNESSLGFFRVDSVRDGRFWKVFDLDSDGIVELVQSTPYKTEIDPIVFGESGVPGWKIFSSSASGFETDGRWNLPVTGHVGGFFSPDEQVTNQNGIHWYWATTDINGDGLLDLVHTANSSLSSPLPNSWGTSSSPFWMVYFGDGESFATEHTVWTLPLSGQLNGFYSVQAKGWKVFDVDGDGQVELVQTLDPATSSVWIDKTSAPYWKIFRRL